MHHDRRAYWTLTTTELPLAERFSFPLVLEGITKDFGKVKALDDVSFALERGAVHALLGENGAGKTTLMRVAFGLIQPDSGKIRVDGEEKHFRSPVDAIAAGIGMVHQQFSLIPAMTVAENIALGGRGRLSIRDVAQRISELGKSTGLVIDPLARVATLGPAERQKLEILRTLAHDARIMILDEPTAVLTERDVGELFVQIKQYTNSGGSVVLITHKLRDALEHADHITVLRQGRVVHTSTAASVTQSELEAAMIGNARNPVVEKRGPSTSGDSEIVASLEHVILDSHSPRPVEFNVAIRRGEVIGVAALEGAARPLMHTLAGRLRPVSGRLDIPTRVGFVSENRQDDALIENFSLTENVALANAAARSGVIDWQAIDNETGTIVRDYDVRTNGTALTPAELSGGNQQRFVLGRELSGKPDLLVLENPTQGLDLNAAAFVHRQMRQAAADGTGVVFYSSDLDELAEFADRVIVVSSTGLALVSPDRSQIGRILLSV
jgi:ABC-type uncharacterized transport systems, ATPase components